MMARMRGLFKGMREEKEEKRGGKERFSRITMVRKGLCCVCRKEVRCVCRRRGEL